MSIHIHKQQKANTLSELIDYYEVCNRAKSKSHRTISWYSANLKRFLSYLKKRHLSESLDSIDSIPAKTVDDLLRMIIVANPLVFHSKSIDRPFLNDLDALNKLSARISR